MILKGVFTALVTPFLDGKVDFSSLERLIEKQLQDGVDGFVVNGTTGESPTLKEKEREEIFRLVRKLSPADKPVFMGTGSNSTEETRHQSIRAEKWGADALLIVVPYYNKPPQRGLLEHFKSVANQTSLPVFLYNVPGRTVTTLELETIKKLSEHPQIAGIKEATGNLEFARQIRQQCGQEFILLSGDDGTYDDFMKIGGDGVISVASHIIPQAMRQKRVSDHQALIDLLFCEANPIPVKMALFFMGLIKSPECRLPLVTLSESWSLKLRSEMKKTGLLK